MKTLLLALSLLLPFASHAWELETGIVTLTGSTTISFSQAFPTVPVVVPVADTLQTQPVQVRVSAVSTTGFTLTPVRPSGVYAVAPVVVHYLAAEVGEYRYPNGTRFAAGRVSTSALLPASGGSAWQTVTLATAFSATPAVLSAPQTSANGSFSGGTASPWLVSTARSVASTGFQLALDGGSSYSGTLAQAETLGWIAQAPGSSSFLPADGTAAINYQAVGPSSGIVGPDDNPDGNVLTPFPTDCATLALSFTPLVALAGKTSRNDSSGGWVRRCLATSNGVTLTLDEPASGLPPSRNNTVDTVSALAFSRGFHAAFGVVADYHLDECSLALPNSPVIDYSPYGHTATALSLARLSLAASSPGPLCQAAGYANSSARLSTTSTALLNLRGQLTLAAWLRHDGSANNALSTEYKTLIAKGSNAYRLSLEKICVATPLVGSVIVDPASALLGCANGLLVDRRWAYVGRLEIYNGLTGTGPPFAVRTAPVGQGALWDPAGEVLASSWQHLAASYDGLQLQIYLNGVLRGSVSAGGSVIPVNGNSQALTVGYTIDSGGSVSSPFSGAIDEPTVWNIPLPLSQIDSDHRLRTRSCGHCGRQIIYKREVYGR